MPKKDTSFKKKSSRRGSQHFSKFIELIPCLLRSSSSFSSSFKTLSSNYTTLLSSNEISLSFPEETCQNNFETSFLQNQESPFYFIMFSHLVRHRFETTSRIFRDRTSSYCPIFSTSNIHSKTSSNKIIVVNKIFDFSSRKK